MEKYRVVFEALKGDRGLDPQYAIYVSPSHPNGVVATRLNLSRQDLIAAMNSMGLSLSTHYLILTGVPGSPHTVAECELSDEVAAEFGWPKA
jgi:hypothetical protein